MKRYIICGIGEIAINSDFSVFTSNIIDGTCEACRDYLINKDYFIFNNNPSSEDLIKVSKENKILVSRFNSVVEKEAYYSKMSSMFEDDLTSNVLTYWSTWVFVDNQEQFERIFLEEFNKRMNIYKQL